MGLTDTDRKSASWRGRIISVVVFGFGLLAFVTVAGALTGGDTSPPAETSHRQKVADSKVLPVSPDSADSVAPDGDCTKEMVKADTREALALMKDLRADTRDWVGLYSEALVRAIADVYKFGPGTPEKPACKKVTRKFCREWAMGLFQKMVAGGGGTYGASPGDQMNADHLLSGFTKEAAQLLRKELLDFLKYAGEGKAYELSPEQRERLYYLAGDVLTSADTVATGILRIRADDESSSPTERSAAKEAVSRIVGRE